MDEDLTSDDFWKLMDEYAAAFGWIAMHWSRLERNMSALLQRLAGTTAPTAEAIFLPLNADSRQKLLRALVRLNIHDEALRAKLMGFLGRFDEARVKRNHYMHSSVAWVDPNDRVMRQHRDSQRGELKKAVAEVPLAEVKQLQYDLNGLSNEVLADFCFHSDFHDAFAAILHSTRAQ